MPPRTKAIAKRPTRSVPLNPSTSAAIEQLPETYPWPRKEGLPIPVDDPALPSLSVDKWDKIDAKHYNAFLDVAVNPTRYVDASALSRLGLHEDVHAVLHAMGIASLCYETESLFPDLVRQCLATAEISYTDENQPTFDTAFFSFFAGGKKYQLSLDTFTEVYEMENEIKGIAFPKKFPPTQPFWELIASGEFKSRSASQSLIRNPTLRIVAKVLSNLLLAKEITAKVTNGELQMLYAGIEDEIRAANARIPIATMKTNPGFILAQVFVEKKARALQKEGTKSVERCGNLLTPLFRHLGIDFAPYTPNANLEYIDIPYLIHCGILRDETTYSFQDREGNALYCKLPQPSITGLDVFENITFLPGVEHLCADPKAAPPTPLDATMEDVEEVIYMHSSMDTSAYDLDQIVDNPDAESYRRWMVDAQRKNNGLLKRILNAVTGGCAQAPNEGTSRAGGASVRVKQEKPSASKQAAAEGTRRARNRRYNGQSESEDTE